MLQRYQYANLLGLSMEKTKNDDVCKWEVSDCMYLYSTATVNFWIHVLRDL
jgi:hypothetical protein